MRRPLHWVWKKAVELAPKLATQVTVSVAATLCTALITGAVVDKKPAPAPAVAAAPALPAIPGSSFDPRRGADLIQASFSAEGPRSRPSHPVEFGAVFGPSTAAPLVVAREMEWSVPGEAEPTRLAASEPESEAEIEEPKKPSPAPSCTQPCRTRVAAVPSVRPPPRPLDLAAAADEPAPSPVVAASDEKPRLLGFAMPGFVPTGQAIASTVVAMGDKVTGLIGIS